MSEFLKLHKYCMPEECPLYDACSNMSDMDSIESCVDLLMKTEENLSNMLKNPKLEADYRESYQKTLDEVADTLDKIPEGPEGWEV